MTVSWIHNTPLTIWLWGTLVLGSAALPEVDLLWETQMTAAYQSLETGGGR